MSESQIQKLAIEPEQKLKQIEEELRRMSFSFAKILEVDFSERPDVLKGSDEMSRLIAAFHFMLEDLQRAQSDSKSYQKKLEEEVIRKTQELHKHKTNLEKAQHIARMGSWDLNLTSKAISWSDEMFVIFGVDRQTFTPTEETILSHVHPDDRQRFTHELERVAKEQKTGVFDFRVVRNDGGERILRSIVEVELDSKGVPVILNGISSDVTDYKLQEYSLREERDRVKTILQTIGEGLIVVDQYFKIMLINPVAQRELGVTVGEAIGDDLRSLVLVDVDGQKLEDSSNPFTTALTSGEIFDVDLSKKYFFSNRGYRFPVSLVVTPLRSETGIDVYGLVVVFKNIAHEKKFDDAKANFISIASHQLRTPLTPMRWFSEMLLVGDMGELNAQQKKLVEDIHENVDRMTTLINLLLQIARVESGRVKVLPNSLDLVAVINEVVQSLKYQLDERGNIVLVVCEPQDFPRVTLDKDILWQVIQNLLTNAIRYSQRKAQIIVSLSLRDDMVLCSVQDTGIGIPKDEQSRIFEKFFRASNAFHMVPEGTGLGLSLIKSIVDDWGGKVWFETEENKGTSFYFTIPKAGVKAREGDVGIAV